MNENLPPNVLVRLMKEIRVMCKSPPDGIRVNFNEEDMTNIVAEIEGPVGTPFEGGLFHCKLVLGSDFPSVPPKGIFLTKIFHPNVSKTGEICVNTLKKDWKPSLGIERVLTIIRCLLIHPNPESALNEDAGKLLLESYDDFASRAKLLTQIHAKPKGAKSLSKKGDVGGVEDANVAKKKTKSGTKDGAKKIAKKKSLRRL